MQKVINLIFIQVNGSKIQVRKKRILNEKNKIIFFFIFFCNLKEKKEKINLYFLNYKIK